MRVFAPFAKRFEIDSRSLPGRLLTGCIDFDVCGIGGLSSDSCRIKIVLLDQKFVLETLSACVLKWF